jgi:uncharacterized protein YhjY with autotransporter beta-barrel domain
MKTYLGRIFLGIFMIGIIAPAHLYAACQIVGYTINGYIVVCDGPDAIGVTSGNGNDIVTIETGAEVSKVDLQSADSAATAAATAINAQGGDDQITNTGSVRANASMTINAEDVVATHLGNEETNASITGKAVAVGIDSGRSDRMDSVMNNGTIEVTATSNVKGGQIQLDLLDVTKADATLTANATATGIKGTGNNEIVNNSTITVTSSASVTAWTGEVNVLDWATANTTVTPNATSTGIAGGTGYDRITNTGVISATATTSATVPIGELNLFDLAVAGAGIGTEEVPMEARAIGIDAGDAGSEIVNTAAGKITAHAESSANIESVVLTLYDFTVTSDILKSAGSIAAHVSAIATGISGGSGRDMITNGGEISATATSLVGAAGLGVGAEGVPSGIVPNFYKPADATITTTSTATGIQGGAGNDDIINTGKITTAAEATTGSGTLSVSFPLLELTKWAKPWNDFPPAIAIASAGTSAETHASGIDAGEGNDLVFNYGDKIEVDATSLATTNNVSVVGQNVKTPATGGWYLGLDLALANATTKAKSSAIGIDGGKGNDFIYNAGMIDVDASSTVIGNAVSVIAQNLKGMEGLGVAIARTVMSTEGTATATGLNGGEGDDEILNRGQLDVDANSFANSFSANVDVQGEIKGVGVGVAFADVTTTSAATATGILGGDGSDKITHGVGGLHAYATAEAYAESFSVSVQAESKGVEIGGALALGTTTATATASGMDGGTGDNTFLNQGFMDVKAEATANTLAASVDVQAGVKGVGAGIALIDTTTSTTTTATGIFGSEGNGFITNYISGTMMVRADSNTYAEQFAVTVQGESTGLELGGALALGATTATATATGIGAGKEGDEIHNYGMVDVRADATTNNLAVAVDVQGSVNGVGLGVAFTDVSSAAATEATGISSGESNDTIFNSATGTVKAYAESDSYSEVLSVDVQGKGTGIMIGGALALAGSAATATATGMDGGAGEDAILNQGFTDVNATSTGNSLAVAVTVQGKVDGFGGQAALTDTSTSSTATTTGISGGDGTDIITNSVGATVKSYATAEAYAESVSLSVQGYGTGVTMAGSLARGVTTPTASATGISGGEGDDTLVNQGLTDVKAATDSTSVAVSVRAVGLIEGISVGASLTDTSTTANATATGIDGGSGNDAIYNSGNILANTDSTLRAASVSFDFGGAPIGVSVGAALASASTHATGTATGISGGEGNDDITNATGSLIDVDSTANATSTAVSISANVIGAAWTNTSATTLTQATGIAGGGGKDGIANLGTVDVDSNSTAKVANVSVNLIGATPVSGWTSSTAKATGIDAGLGEDWIQNEGAITVDATSTTDATGVAVQIAGYSDMDAATHAVASATGIRGGDGVNTIYNTSTGSIQATATTYGDTTAVNINLLGYSKTDGSSTGDATAIGIAGGKEADTIRNDGTIHSTATSDIDASSTAVQLIGYGESSAKGISNATVKGIDGGEGANTLINIGSITGTATVYADASSYDVQLSGGAKAAAGTEATATALGIAGGKDMDAIRNEGTINLTAQSTLVSESRSYKFFGVGIANAESAAVALSTGIDGGEGANTIVNASTGSITVSSNAGATATGLTANIGVAGASASTTSNAHSVGIKSGGGHDIIINEGILNANATSSAYAGSGDLSLIGLSFGDALTEAVTDGINAGGGNDFILNTGSITVGSVQDNDHPMAYSNVDSVSLSLFNISIATFGSKAQATGIIGGGGDDTILNAGTITVGDDDWMAKGRGYGFSGQFFDFFSLTGIGATVETVSTGIEGGDGNDFIWNDSSGVLTVKATSYAWTEGAADVTTFGSPAAFASSTTKATATGISSGEENDVIQNKGEIDVYAHTFADASSDSWVGWGSPRADSTADATATAIGIDAGGGRNFVMNSGLINASALAETSPYAKADSDVDYTDAETTSYSRSTALGVLAGDDSNTVDNTATGKIIVTAIARTSDAEGNIAKAESDEKATVTVRPASNAIGIQAGRGNNLIFNDGQITVGSEVHADSHASASSTLYTATATAKTGGSADATGIKVGDGNNIIKNAGALTITATNEATALSNYPTAHLDKGVAYAGGGDTSLTANAIGISAGNGINLIENQGSMTVSSTVDADARAFTNTATTTTYAEAYAGGNATAAGIFAGNGKNMIKNDGTMTVSATANAYALGSAEEYGSAYIGSESSPGIVAETIGISAGHGINTISNTGTMEVNATATATAEATGDNSTQTIANSYATATGIRTGDGINIVTNFGMIDVTAYGVDTSAVGIQTGAGNDTIINSGSITTANKILFFSRPGIAITSGAGNDQVFLMNGSETNGHIDLGDGDDGLTFTGTPTVNGNITAANGIDTLVFDGAGSIGFTPMAFEHGIKRGAGTFTVANLPSMQRIEIKQGVLQVNTDYQFSNNGSFETFVKGDGSFGQFKVNGTIELAGDLSVLKGPGPYKNGATYNIIEVTGAQVISGAFSDFLLPPPKPLLRFDVNQLPHAIEVEVHAPSCTTVATNRVERTLGSYLDRIMPTATGDLSNVLGEFQSLSLSQFGAAFSSLSPDSYDNYTRATYDSAWQYTRSLHRRLNNIRTYGTTTGYDPESKPLLLAFAGSDANLGQLFATGQFSQTQAKNGLWFNGYGQSGDQEPDKGFTGFDYNLYGGALGFDHAFNNKLIAGLSLGYSRTDVSLDHHYGNGDIKSLTGSVYGSYFTRNAYVEGAVSYGRNWYDNDRLITVGPLQRKASSDHEGDLFSVFLGGGYAFNIKDWAIGPFASLRYIYLNEESFRERGADSLNLRVDHRNTDSLTSELGLRLARIFEVKYGSLIPEVSAAWSYDFDIDDRVITATFEGSPGAAFSIDGQPVERNGAVLGVGLTFIHKSGFSTSLRYRGEFREKYDSHGVMGELRLTF